ncbi:MAG: hypothetical protein KBS57_00660 [Alistipes sp.]|nr:hypothetical protein [Candidatus Minthomonas equi]
MAAHEGYTTAVNNDRGLLIYKSFSGTGGYYSEYTDDSRYWRNRCKRGC